MAAIRLLQAEITGKCQARCVHCFNDSGPKGSNGTMTADDWRRVFRQAADVGTEVIQIVGGEPMLHPALPDLIAHALNLGVRVEVYSNLVYVPSRVWDLLTHPRMSVATSWYSADPAEHNRITGRPTHARIKANILALVARSVPLRVGVIDIDPRQNASQALEELRRLGVTDCGIDRVRHLGRATTTTSPDTSQLCGHCGQGIVTVLPSGDVVPCPMGRWLVAGSVHSNSLADLIDPVTALARHEIPAATGVTCRPPCEPQCHPGQDQCAPEKDGCVPTKNCNPAQPCKPRNPCRPDVTCRPTP
ncbi:radical SAM protein [Rhizohabitans arisaemae]|uniref:radical SAM protein n=1 Tax=Rhizohabitans arisaemae TaxID=2720610 RepID=UPI0024B108CE|nr:radical SAM protein [Rhizohabitans arisaemae]